MAEERRRRKEEGGGEREERGVLYIIYCTSISTCRLATVALSELAVIADVAGNG